MPGKFACLNYVDDRKDIPVRFGLIRKAPPSFLDWYVEKFNPFTVGDMAIVGEEGYKVFMPLTKEDAAEQSFRGEKIIEKTLRSLADYDVEVILPPKNVEIVPNRDIWVADGRRLLPFFMTAAIKKGCKAAGVHLKTAEVLIINDDISMTEAVIDNILYDVNFLTVADIGGDGERLKEKAKNVFAESGLNIQIVEDSKQRLKSADIVVNTWREGEKYDYAYKKRGVLFDLTGHSGRVKVLSEKRGDMLIVDGLQVSVGQVSMPLYMLELAFYLKSREYRFVCRRGYTTDIGAKIAGALDHLEVSATGFSILGRVISSGKLSRFCGS